MEELERMEREFIIKASTSEAIDSMMANAFQAMKIDVGTAFLPAKKEISVALIDFINQLRSMPELGQIAQQLATLFSQGVRAAADGLEKALPTIQKFLGYLVDNGPQVLSFLGKLAAAFVAMKFAPGIEGLIHLWGARLPFVSPHTVQVFGAVQVASAHWWPSGSPSVFPHTLQVLAVLQVASCHSWSCRVMAPHIRSRTQQNRKHRT